MVTIVNNPQPASSDGDGGGMGFLMGILIIIVVIFLFIYYGLPAIRTATQVPQINVPEKVDININQTQ